MGELRYSRSVGEREVGVGTWCLLGLYRKTQENKGNSKYNVPSSQSGGVARECS